MVGRINDDLAWAISARLEELEVAPSPEAMALVLLWAMKGGVLLVTDLPDDRHKIDLFQRP